jgi:hypothetical protein
MSHGVNWKILRLSKVLLHFAKKGGYDCFDVIPDFVDLFVCLFVYSHTSNFSAIWWLSPLPVTGLQI